MIDLNKFPYAKFPNPRYRRETFIILNGEWEFDFLDEFKVVEKLNKKIIVPFAYESKASGINDQTMHNYMMYRRHFHIEEKGDYLLHFEGVDYKAEVYLNGVLLAKHEGCYTSFDVFINKKIICKDNELIVLVYDSFDKFQLRGKQRTRPENYECWYTQYSGIIGDVYLEKVGVNPINHVLISGDKNGNIDYQIYLSHQGKCKLEIFDNQKVIKSILLNGNEKYVGKESLDSFNLYDEKNPYLYDVRVTSYGLTDDVIDTYFGFRSIENKSGKIYINDSPAYLRMILNQGYYKDKLIYGLDNEIYQDIITIKELGFNGIRIHQKIERNIFYYICDVLGIYLTTEIPSPYEYSQNMKDEFVNQLKDILFKNYNSPSIIINLLFNESWGISGVKENKEIQQFVLDTKKITKEIDSTRLDILNDGWHQLSETDILSLHDYEQNSDKLYEEYKNKDYVIKDKIINTFGSSFADGNSYHNQPIILSEFGGASLKDSSGWGYGEKIDNVEAYKNQLKRMMSVVNKLDYLSGYCYTQLCDVQQETNGLLDEDHNSKIPVSEYRKLILGE